MNILLDIMSMTIHFFSIETGSRGRGYYDTVTFMLLLLLTVFASKNHDCS